MLNVIIFERVRSAQYHAKSRNKIECKICAKPCKIELKIPGHMQVFSDWAIAIS